MLEEIAQSFIEHGDGDFRDELLHMVACKAAIKSGRQSEYAETLALVRRVFSGEIKYCPHGRPVSVPMDKTELDKLFDRRK